MDKEKLWTQFIQDTGYHYLARDEGGDAIGIVFVPGYPEDDMVRARIIGRSRASFELLKPAQVETFREMDLVPDLRLVDTKKVEVKTVSGGTVVGWQLDFVVPTDDYDPTSEEARTVVGIVPFIKG